MNYTSGRESLPLLGEKLWFIEFVSKKNIGTPINGVYCDGRSPLCCLSFLFWGSLGSAVGKDNVHRNARRRPRRSVDPDQTSFRSNLIWVYTAQAHLTEKLGSFKFDQGLYCPGPSDIKVRFLQEQSDLGLYCPGPCDRKLGLM